MKKIISILLISIFILSALSACQADEIIDSGEDTVPSSDTFEDTVDSDTDPVVEDTDRGELVLNVPKSLYINYPAVPLTYTFTKPEYAELVTFTTSNPILKVENGKIWAEGTIDSNKLIRVTAKSENFEVTARVTVSAYQGSVASGASLNLENQIVNRQNQLTMKSGGDLQGGVLFVGDSFFNPDNWWTNFYSEYAGKKAFTVGISSTTTEDWQIISERLVYPYSPKAVVIHCGTNDIFDDGDNAATVSASLKTLFETYHQRMPQAKIYWFSIEPRVNKSFDVPKEVNDTIKSYANGKDWLVYIDSASWCFNSNGTVNSAFFKDGVHPQNSSYAKYRQALVNAGVTYANLDPNKQTLIPDITRQKSQAVGNSATKISYRGKDIVTEYVISGTFTVTDIANNGHAEFQFNSYENRFLLWDSDNNRKIGVGWAQKGATTVRETGNELFNVGDTIQWKLLFTSKNAYLYINGKLKAVYYNVISPVHLVISTEGMTAKYTNIVVKTKAADPSEYSAALAAVASYESQTGTTTRVVRV